MNYKVDDAPVQLEDGPAGVRALLGDPAMPVERAREEVWAVLARDLGLERGGEQVWEQATGTGH